MSLAWQAGRLPGWCLSVLAAPASAQWNGHVATLGEAQILCRSFDSSLCVGRA
jgi:hypothetical protein